MIIKKNYQKPSLEVIEFESEDIIDTSNGVTAGSDPDVPDAGVAPEW